MTKINVQPLIEEFGNPIYIIKLLLKEMYNIPVVIDPLNVKDTNISVSYGCLEYKLEGSNFEYRYN